jgi:hypothetical protein
VVWKAHLLNMSSGLASDDVRSGLTYFSPFESFLYDYTISIVLDKKDSLIRTLWLYFRFTPNYLILII